MKMKKLVAGIMACCIVGGVTTAVYDVNGNTAVIANADGTYESENFKYTSDGTITGLVDDTVSEITIPALIDGTIITTIGDNAFEDCRLLENVTLPDSLETIGNYAFSECISLKEITIPENVSSIGDYAFNDCSSLESLEFPSGVKTISKYVAYNCGNLKQVVIKGAKTIQTFAFSNCTKLETVYIPKTMGEIYRQYSNLSTKADAFSGCPLKAVYYAGTAEQWTSINGGISIEVTVHYESSTPSYMKYDINRDGKVDASDASEILRIYSILSTGGTI